MARERERGGEGIRGAQAGAPRVNIDWSGAFSAHPWVGCAHHRVAFHRLSHDPEDRPVTSHPIRVNQSRHNRWMAHVCRARTSSSAVMYLNDDALSLSAFHPLPFSFAFSSFSFLSWAQALWRRTAAAMPPSLPLPPASRTLLSNLLDSLTPTSTSTTSGREEGRRGGRTRFQGCTSVCSRARHVLARAARYLPTV